MKTGALPEIVERRNNLGRYKPSQAWWRFTKNIN
jgi:hypothetical protein